ncbi:MAG: GNAT family N-acetyltransferase [Bryobacteraceae bacterium]|nr:GNAT family N-acetyltransferase [Bryobacteraceae bacterium]
MPPFLAPGSLSDGELALRLTATVPGNDTACTVPTYRFDLRLGEQTVGGLRFRAGSNDDIVLYAGNLGYNVDPEFRGHRFAERACRLLLPFAVRHGFQHLWITCDPENTASRLTCERLGAELVEIITLPEWLDMYQDGERAKCRYRLDLFTATTRSRR